MPQLKRTAFAMALAATALTQLPGCRPASMARATTPINTGADAAVPELPGRRELARDVYVAGVPLLARYAVVHARNIDRDNPHYQGPLNTLHWTAAHDASTAAASLDLRDEPVVVRVPALASERIYVLQLTDLLASVPAQISSRSTGNRAGDYLVVGPDWQGTVPPGITDVIHSDTTLVSVSGWVQRLGTDTARERQQLKRGFRVQLLSRYLAVAPPAVPARSSLPQPLPAELARHSAVFFAQLDALLPLAPAHAGEVDLRRRLQQLEVQSPQRARASAATRALREGMADGQREIDQRRAALNGCDADAGGDGEALHSDAVSRACAAQRTL